MKTFAAAFATFYEAAESVESIYYLPQTVNGCRIWKMGRSALCHICIVLDQVPDDLQRGFKELPMTLHRSGEAPNNIVTIGFFDDDGAWFIKTSRKEFHSDFEQIDKMDDFDVLVTAARSMMSYPVNAGIAFAAWMTLKNFRERKYRQELVSKETLQLGSPSSPAVGNRRLSSGGSVVRGNPEVFVSPSGLSDFLQSPLAESRSLGTLLESSEPFEEGCTSTPDYATRVVEPLHAAAENTGEESLATIVIPSWEPDIDAIELSEARQRLSSAITRTSSIFEVPPETQGGSIPGERRGSLAGLTEAPDFARLPRGRKVKSLPPTVAPTQPEVTALEVSDLMVLLQRHVHGKMLDTADGCRLIEALVYPVFEYCGRPITPRDHMRHMALFVDVMDDRVAQDRWPQELPKWLVYGTLLCHSIIDTFWRV